MLILNFKYCTYRFIFYMKGSTPTESTGPSGAVEGSQYYYLETSSPAASGDIATMSSRVNLPGK